MEQNPSVAATTLFLREFRIFYGRLWFTAVSDKPSYPIPS